MSKNPNLDALSSIQIKFDNLKKDIDDRTKLMQDMNDKICNAYRLLPYNDNLDLFYHCRTIETELEQMKRLCLQLESESMTKNFTTEIDKILVYLKSCRNSTDIREINKDMQMIEIYAKELKKYTSAITVEHEWFQKEINKASMLFPMGFKIDDIMKDLNNKLPEDFDKHLKNIWLKIGYFSEPYKSHIESAIAAILSELQEFRESAESQRLEPHGGKQPTVSEAETFSVVSRRHAVGKFDDVHEIDIRRYGPPDGLAVYQEWIDGKFSRTLPDFRQSEAQYKFTANAPILEELKEFRESRTDSVDNVLQSQNMYCVNISTGHRIGRHRIGPVTYFEMKDLKSNHEKHLQEKADYEKQVNRVKKQHAALHHHK
jgi:hypothetical protein